jgi:Tfp pilus assembly protein FimT
MIDGREREGGLSLIETLVVIVLLAISMTMASALVLERVRAARIRVAAARFEIDLRSARLTAVSNRKPVEVVVAPEPANTYQYTDSRGRFHEIQMPLGVRIVSSTSPIRFLPNGSVLGGASTVFETELSTYDVDRWVVDTSALGLARIRRDRP